MQRPVVAVVCSLGSVLPAQSPVPASAATPPAKVAELLPEFAAACAADDGARVGAALARIAAASDAALALPTLREQRLVVPLPALVAWAKSCAELLPFAPASAREQAGAVDAVPQL